MYFSHSFVHEADKCEIHEKSDTVWWKLGCTAQFPIMHCATYSIIGLLYTCGRQMAACVPNLVLKIFGPLAEPDVDEISIVFS